MGQMTKMSRRKRSGPQPFLIQKFSAYLVVSCFEKRRPEQTIKARASSAHHGKQAGQATAPEGRVTNHQTTPSKKCEGKHEIQKRNQPQRWDSVTTSVRAVVPNLFHLATHLKI